MSSTLRPSDATSGGVSGSSRTTISAPSGTVISIVMVGTSYAPPVL
jgi:hypothetical protein